MNWTDLSKIVCTIAKWFWAIGADNKTRASSSSTHDHSFVRCPRLPPVMAYFAAIMVLRWSYDGPQVATAVRTPFHVSAGQLERVLAAWRRRKNHLGEGLLCSWLTGSAVRRRMNNCRFIQLRRTFESHTISDDWTSAVVRNNNVNSLVETCAFVCDGRRSPGTDCIGHSDRTVVGLLQYWRACTAASSRQRQFQIIQRRVVNFRLTLPSLHGVEIHHRCRTTVVDGSFATYICAVTASLYVVFLVAGRRPSAPASLTIVTAEKVHWIRCTSGFSTLSSARNVYLMLYTGTVRHCVSYRRRHLYTAIKHMLHITAVLVQFETKAKIFLLFKASDDKVQSKSISSSKSWKSKINKWIERGLP